MKPFYKETVSQAWKIALTKKTLWWLAFFASFLGTAPTFQSIFDLFPEDGQRGINLQAITQSDFITSNFVGWSESFYRIPWNEVTLSEAPILAILVFILIFVIFLAVMVVASEGGLIVAADQSLKNRKAKYLESFRSGLDKFWEIFILHFAFRLIYLLIFGAVITPMVFWALSADPGTRILITTVSYFILIPTLIILDIVVRYAVMFVMLKNRGVIDAFNDAWSLFKKNWLISIETALLIFGALIVFALALVVVTTLIYLLFVMIILNLPSAFIAYDIALFTGAVTIIGVTLISIAIFTTFYLTVWTSIFRRLQREPHYSKIHRSSRHLPALHKKIGK